jgi:prepilin-type N-terminal cleavage/methylation domain-containing protein
MKNLGLRRRQAGFSLMELIVVVAIIVVLAGLSLRGYSLITQKSARTKADVQVKLLAKELQEYHADNRSYPVNADPNGERGDEVLYKALYWDGYEARDSGGKIYVKELDPTYNTKGGQAWMQGTQAQARIVDPWGNYYRYRTGEQAINPDFDLWSVGPDKKTNPDPKHKDSLDDIKSW